MGTLRDLWSELWAERSRMAMVTLGLVWGTLSLTVLMAFGQGTHVAMTGVLANSGQDLLRLWAGGTSRPFAGLPAGRVVRLRYDDVQALRTVPGVRAVSAEFAESVQVSDGTRTLPANLVAVDESYAAIRGMRARAGGRFVNTADLRERRRVVVLASELVRRLFGARDPIGRTVQLWGTPFQVVGVLEPRLTVMNYGGSDDIKAIIPATTGIALRGWRFVTYGLVAAAEPARDQELERAVRRTLAGRLRFDPEDRRAVGLESHIADARLIGNTIAGTRAFLWIVGALGLLVAAMAVANVMYVMVEERVPEIGLRIAVGATPRQILGRHLLEALAVVLTGGGLGLLLSAGLLLALDQVPMDPMAKGYLGRPLVSVATAVGVAGLLGLAAGVAGWFPARRAAAVEPVEALRHE